MKTVFGSIAETCHVWAQNKQGYGTQGGPGRVFFEGPTLYSYGHHFIVGHIMSDGVVFLNADSYSVSTGNHQRNARDAVSHRTCNYLPDLTHVVKSGLLSKNTDKATANRELRRYLQSHFETGDLHDEDSALYLLRLHKFRDPVRTLNAIKDKAARAVERAKVKAAKNAKILSLRDARDLVNGSEGPDALIARDFARITESSYGQEHRFKYVTARLSRAHKAAKSAGYHKQSKAVWAVLKRVRADYAELIHAAERARVLSDRKALIAGIRETVKQHREHPATVTSSQYGTLSRELYKAATCLPVRADMAERLNAASDRAEQWAKTRAEQERYEREMLEAKRREAWLAGVSGVHWHGADSEGRALLRAKAVVRDDDGHITGGELQTSRGATVPLTHAVKAFRFIKLCKQRGKAWQANGKSLPVGHFRVSDIDEQGNFTAACHCIGWNEVERLAKDLGVFDIEAGTAALTD